MTSVITTYSVITQSSLFIVCWTLCEQFSSVLQSCTHSDSLFSPVLQVRSRTGARGTAATGALLVQMSWRVITGSTRVPNLSSAPSAHVPFPDPTTSPCTWRDTRTSVSTHNKHTSTVSTHMKYSFFIPMLQAAWCRAASTDNAAPPGAAIMCSNGTIP